LPDITPGPLLDPAVLTALTNLAKHARGAQPPAPVASDRRAGALVGDAVAHSREELGELPPVRGIESGEQLVLSFALSCRRPVELALAGCGQGHHVATAIARVAPPLDQTAFLQRVEQLDQGAGVDLHRLVEVALAAGAGVIATARPGAEEEFVRGLGARLVVDYAGDLEAQVRAIAPDGVPAIVHLSGDGVPTNRVMLYGPRDEDEVGVLLSLIEAAVRQAGGRAAGDLAA
jgi:hypothetical protein